MSARWYALSCALACAALLSCGQLSVGGGASEVEVVGRLYFPGGEAASRTLVKLVPRHYNAVTMEPIPDSLCDTSDASGEYSFRGVSPGTYNVLAVHLSNRTRALIVGVDVAPAETTIVPSSLLLDPGAIRLLLPRDSGRSVDGYAVIPGTDIAAFASPQSAEVLLDSVPAGIIPEVRFFASGESAAIARADVVVSPGATVTIANPSWKYSRRLLLNTTASGAYIKENVLHFPVLLRLTEANFDFDQPLPDGADIRFTKPDNTFLPYEIERWDVAAKRAEVWVRVDTVYGNNDAQHILMYWGNPSASAASSPATVFDTALGFQGVWHMSERGNEVALDATANRYDGLAYGMSGFTWNPGVVGNARVFNGTTSYITMPNTAKSTLDFPQEGTYAVSAWVLLDALDNASHVIVAKGYEQYYLRVTSLRSTVPLWEFVEFNETAKWQTSTAPAAAGRWTLLTAVRQGNKQLLYCNGELVDSTVEIWQNAVSRNTANDLSIGRFMRQVTVPISEGYNYFKGSIDEVRILNTAPSPYWIRLCYLNQRSDDRLVQFR